MCGEVLCLSQTLEGAGSDSDGESCRVSAFLRPFPMTSAQHSPAAAFSLRCMHGKRGANITRKRERTEHPEPFLSSLSSPSPLSLSSFLLLRLSFFLAGWTRAVGTY